MQMSKNSLYSVAFIRQVETIERSHLEGSPHTFDHIVGVMVRCPQTCSHIMYTLEEGLTEREAVAKSHSQ